MKTTTTLSTPVNRRWAETRIRRDEIERYLDRGRAFIDPARIQRDLCLSQDVDRQRVDAILEKSLAIETLTLQETAALLRVQDPDLWLRMEEVAGQVKKKVYDNRIVTFAPLYLGNVCINDCRYCGFRRSNRQLRRCVLSQDAIRQETEVLAGRIGHKRLIVVFGEHPAMDVNYMCATLETISDVKVKTRRAWAQIHRCNVNAPPLNIEELKQLKAVGIGTYQVFQETYHPETYRFVHPAQTVKGDYLWRLYSMHRAMEAGIDDVGIGALFGLYDWRFEVMGLLAHARELEQRFGIGPHTISFPRLEEVPNTSFPSQTRYGVTDGDFRKLVTVLRLAVPHTGLILTARENAAIRRNILPLGCTQTDASSRIDIGGYADRRLDSDRTTQQFLLGDTRSLDTVVRELAEAGLITSFCTAGYRCGRTGQRIMNLLRCGKEGHLCKLNAVITFREWLDDFASPETLAVGEKVITAEIREIQQTLPQAFDPLMDFYKKTQEGQRDLFF